MKHQQCPYRQRRCLGSLPLSSYYQCMPLLITYPFRVLGRCPARIFDRYLFVSYSYLKSEARRTKIPMMKPKTMRRTMRSSHSTSDAPTVPIPSTTMSWKSSLVYPFPVYAMFDFLLSSFGGHKIYRGSVIYMPS